jgi:hypothetical protein
MKKRLLEAKARQTGISLEEACEKLGIWFLWIWRFSVVGRKRS